jgi:hypothetical protein
MMLSTMQLGLLALVAFLAGSIPSVLVVWGGFSFSLPHGIGYDTQQLRGWMLATVISVQCVDLFVRVLLVALVAQFLFLCLGSRVRLSLTLRAGLLAGTVRGLQVALGAYAAWKFQDADRTLQGPGTLAALYPALADNVYWGGIAKQLSLLEPVWFGLFYWVLASESAQPRRRIFAVVLGAWTIATLIVWLFDLLPRVMA